jgi:hypothetical protein
VRRCLAIAVLFAAPQLSRAACTAKQLTPGWLWNYTGTIGGGDRIRLTFTRVQDSVTGVYFHSNDFRDISVSGKISGDKRLALDEVGGRFDIEFTDHDPLGKFPGTLRCQIISGSWQKNGSGQKLPVYLSLESGAAGKLDHMYEIAGAKDDGLVHRNALRFWKAVNQGDKASVASLIDYPTQVRVAGKLTTIHNAAELLKEYDVIFTPAYRNAIEAALPRNMFANDRGITLGTGEVWFGVTGRVTMLNIPR